MPHLPVHQFDDGTAGPGTEVSTPRRVHRLDNAAPNRWGPAPSELDASSASSLQRFSAGRAVWFGGRERELEGGGINLGHWARTLVGPRRALQGQAAFQQRYVDRWDPATPTLFAAR